MDATQDIVRQVIEKFGTKLCEDIRRCDSILRDYLGNDRLPVSLLIAAMREQIPAELQSPPGGMPESVWLSRLQRRLHDHAGISAEHAMWAIQTWRFAVENATFSGQHFTFQCPHCTELVEADGTSLGAVVACPKCLTRVRLSTDGTQGAEEPLSLIEEAERARPKATVCAGGDGQFRTIMEALAVHPSGAVIRILPGTYREHVVLQQDVELIGQGEVGEVVLGLTDKPCLEIRGGTVNIRGLSFTGESSPRALPCPAVRVSQGHVTLKNCIIASKSGEAMDVTGSKTRLSMFHCSLSSRKRSSLAVRSQATVSLQDCILSESGGSSVVCDSSGLLASGCTITRSKYAGIVVTGSTLTLENSIIAEHVDTGVTLKRSQFRIQGCHINRNSGRGVWVSQSSSGEIRDCDLTTNGHGSLFADGTSEVRTIANRTDR